MHPTLKNIRRRIALEGPLTIAAVMEEALAGRNGYYRERDPLGPEGDFITAPEVSQMFGELIGLWCVDTWQRLGSPKKIQLVEIGPGRGTLMADALRAARVSTDFLSAKRVHLVEINSALREKQSQRLGDHQPHWHESLENVPQGPMLLIANELFDALPIHQLQMTDAGWRERVVALMGEELQFGVAAPSAALGLLRAPHRDAKIGDIAEVSPASIALISMIAQRIAMHGGAALIIDYGPAQSALGDSFQAMKRHCYHPPLEALGQADLTAHVDFDMLKTASEQVGVQVFGPTAQGDFLRALGIELRATMLAQKADAATGELLHDQVHRLIAPEQMGKLFKVLGLCSPINGSNKLDELAGL